MSFLILVLIVVGGFSWGILLAAALSKLARYILELLDK